MAKRWTSEEEGYIREHYGSMTPEGIIKGMAALVGHRRTLEALFQHAYFMGITQKDNQGKYSIHQVSLALGADDKAIKRWKTLGLEMTKGVRCANKRALMIAVDELVEFLQSRPELLNPDNCAPRICREMMFDINAVRTSLKWKRVECKNAENHAVGRSIIFWAPMYEDQPPCPTCGRLVSALAVGKRKERYALTRPASITGLELLSTTQLAFLRSVESRGQATLRDVGEDVHGDEMRGRGMRGIIRATFADKLVRKVARGRVRRHSGPLLLAYELTDAGKAILQEAQALKVQPSKKGPRFCPGCGKKIVRASGQKGALPKWCARDHNSKPACPGLRKVA